MVLETAELGTGESSKLRNKTLRMKRELTPGAKQDNKHKTIKTNLTGKYNNTGWYRSKLRTKT